MKVYIVKELNEIDSTYSTIEGVYTSILDAKRKLKERYELAAEQLEQKINEDLDNLTFSVYTDDYQISGEIVEENIIIDDTTSTILSANIINDFENLLDEHNIVIPDYQREGAEDEACIYGDTYYNLEKDIADTIKNYC